jgi:predicted RNA polymerase sigma factor
VVLATLIRQVGDFQLAEDAIQDAFATAVATWPHDGVPTVPGRGSPSPPAAARSTGSSRASDRGPYRPAGPEAGLELLEPLAGERTLAGYQPLHAARAELLRRAGDRSGAAAAYRRAIALSTDAIERAELERRLDAD